MLVKIFMTPYCRLPHDIAKKANEILGKKFILKMSMHYTSIDIEFLPYGFFKLTLFSPTGRGTLLAKTLIRVNRQRFINNLKKDCRVNSFAA